MESTYGNNTYAICNTSSAQCSIENYEIYGKEVNDYKDLIFFLN